MKFNVLLIVAIITVLVALVNLSFTFTKILDLRGVITGLATEYGYINLSVPVFGNINFSVNAIDFGPGKLDTGVTSNASLATTNESNEAVRGNWSWGSEQKLILDNIGNVNLTLNLSAGKTPSNFLGAGSATAGDNPGYYWNVTDLAGETGSCVNTTASGVYLATATTPGTQFCTPLQYYTGKNSIRIDIELHVPYTSLTGDLGDTITAVATV